MIRVMPVRALAVSELSSLLGVLSHPDRIRIVERLRSGEQDVKTLSEGLDLAQPRASQHLAQLRAHHLVQVRREGRRVHYRLANPGIARWLAEGLDFIEAELRNPCCCILTRTDGAMAGLEVAVGEEVGSGEGPMEFTMQDALQYLTSIETVLTSY